MPVLSEEGAGDPGAAHAQAAREAWQQYTTRPSPAPLSLHHYRTLMDFLTASRPDKCVRVCVRACVCVRGERLCVGGMCVCWG